jgi:hypothetical protein
MENTAYYTVCTVGRRLCKSLRQKCKIGKKKIVRINVILFSADRENIAIAMFPWQITPPSSQNSGVARMHNLRAADLTLRRLKNVEVPFYPVLPEFRNSVLSGGSRASPARPSGKSNV